ncbi:MAG: hypothetical protein M3011_06890 [Actinomycetota bacterium]|nr:hypothetical protein [Actinomycetota bacterium]
MVAVDSVQALVPARCRTVVINVHTDLVATRAVLSALGASNDPVLVVNCEPTEDSRRRFERLMATRNVDVVEAPVRVHGAALDWLFCEVPDERLLLLDSDAEIRSPGVVGWMAARLDRRECFGAGFLWGPFLIDDPEWGVPPHAEILYAERPWVPCVMFDVAAVREALGAGVSFKATLATNELPFLAGVSSFLGARWGPRWSLQNRWFNHLPAVVQTRLATMPLGGLWWARKPYNGFHPHVVVRDTACEIYEHLRYRQGLSFAGTPIEISEGEVHHYLGVTRYVLAGTRYVSHGPGGLDVSPEDVAEEVIARLVRCYDYVWE